MKLIVFLAAVLFSATSYASEADYGNFWFIQCNSPSASTKNQCAAFVMGVARGVQVQAEYVQVKPLICLPEHGTAMQMADVFGKYLTDHPESRNESAGVLVIYALSNAFSCQK